MICSWDRIDECFAYLMQDNESHEWFYGCPMSFCGFHIAHKTTSLTPEEATEKMENLRKELGML